MDTEFFEKIQIKLPNASVIGLVSLGGLFCVHSIVGAYRAATLNHERVQRERSLRTELTEIEERRIIVEAENRIPDSYSVKMHEWDCSVGHLRAPVRTLGNPLNMNMLPQSEPRVLTDINGTPVALLSPDQSVDYALADAAGCPQVDEPFALFQNPVPVDPNQLQPQLSIKGSQ